MIRFIQFCFILLLFFARIIKGAEYTYEIDCNNLRMGQYICPHPDYDFMDLRTQQPKGCKKDNKATGKKVQSLLFVFQTQ
jgi:hypothetical protein